MPAGFGSPFLLFLGGMGASPGPTTPDGVFRINQPATDSEYQIINSLLVSETSSVGDLITITGGVYQDILYGIPFLAGFFGIRVFLEQLDDYATPASSYWQITLTIPSSWGTTTTVYGPFTGSLPANITSKVKIFGYVLTVNIDCTWTLEFDDLVWVVEGFTVFSTGPVSDSGTDFDKRFDCMFIDPDITPVPTPNAPPGCGSSVFASEYTFDYEGNSSVDAMYRWREGGAGAWVYDFVEEDDSTEPPDIGCDCEEGLEAITGGTSASVVTQANFESIRTKSLIATGTEECDEGTLDWEEWRVDETFSYWDNIIYIIPKDWGIPKTQRHISASCDGVTTTPSDTIVIEPFTYCDTERLVIHSEGYRECGTTIPIGCPPPFTLHSGFCVYTGFVHTFHPDVPSCLPQCSGISVVEATHGRPGYYIAYIETDGSLVYRRAWFGEFLLDTAGQIDEHINCCEPRIAYDPWHTAVTVLYNRPNGVGGYNIWRRYSLNHGVEWLGSPNLSTPFYIGVKHAREIYNPRTQERVFVYQDGAGKLQVKIYDQEETSVGSFPSGGGGIGGLVADDTTFELTWVNTISAFDIVFFSGGVKKRYRSLYDARQWFVNPL